MDAAMRHSAGACFLRLDGNWTIERARELRSALMEAMKDSDHLVIETGGVTELDLSTLQLLCSAHRTSIQLGKHLELHGETTEIFKRVVREAGLARTLGCHRDPRKSCLWIGAWKS